MVCKLVSKAKEKQRKVRWVDTIPEEGISTTRICYTEEHQKHEEEFLPPLLKRGDSERKVKPRSLSPIRFTGKDLLPPLLKRDRRSKTTDEPPKVSFTGLAPAYACKRR
jgi:hypothetical protein